MLRTTNKLVIEKLKAHVLENFDQDHYGAEEVTDAVRCNNCMTVYPLNTNTCDTCDTDEFMMSPFMPTDVENLRSQIDYMRYGNRSIYQTALDYVEGGSFLIYYYEQRAFLGVILHQTIEESEKYSDTKVFKLYCHLIARTMANIYTEGK